MAKIQKTNAMRELDSAKIDYNTYTYDCSDGKIDGMAVAEKLNQNPEQVFKTLVAQGHSKEFYVFVLPVNKELDLKKAARSVGEKNVEMIHVKDINKYTGYIRGGCSPLAMKKQYKTVINNSARNYDNIIFSGGKKGVQIETSPTKLASLIGAMFEDIVAESL